MQPPSVKSKLIPQSHGFYGRAGVPEGMAPVLLKQVHGTDVVTVTQFRDDLPEADAAITTNPGVTLAIKTADCAPVLFFAHGVVGVAHAGWGGALKGVLEATVEAMVAQGAKREDIHAAIGPCIAQKSYEVSVGFEKPFLQEDPYAERFFQSGKAENKLMFDLAGYCAFRLARAGVSQVEITGQDTLALESSYFSHRRGALRGVPETGRQLSTISLSSLSI